MSAKTFFSQSTKLRHVYLTYQHDPSKTITINIQGIKTPSLLSVHYGVISQQPEHYARYTHKVIARAESSLHLPDGRQIYHVELKDLLPGATYYFTITDGKNVLCPQYSFRTIPQDNKTPLVFVEGGDWETTPQARSLAIQASRSNPYAALLGGDYPKNVFGKGNYIKWDEWLDQYTETMVTPEGHLIPMVMAIGNHEVIGGFDQSKEAAPFFFHYFRQGNQGESYFFLPFGKRMGLYVLDSGHAASHDGVQLYWLIETLEATQSFPVKMAMYHVPIYPSLRFVEKDLLYQSCKGLVDFFRGSMYASKLYSPKSLEGKKHWLPIFDHYGLTVAFEHHDQTLKRTKLLKQGKEDPQGTLYLGDGGWGPAIQYPPLQGYLRSHFATIQGKVHFFWSVTILEEKIIYKAITATGEVLDQYIQKIRYN